MNTNTPSAQANSNYYIRVKFFYYPGTYLAPKNGALLDCYGERLEFSSRAQAEAHLMGSDEDHQSMRCERNSLGHYSHRGTYYLSHGEYSRKIYTIRKVLVRS